MQVYLKDFTGSFKFKSPMVSILLVAVSDETIIALFWRPLLILLFKMIKMNFGSIIS